MRPLIPMDHFSRCKMMIKKMVADDKVKIEKTRANGKITADYSLGFANAMVFVNHILQNKKGEIQYYNRTTSVGVLPKPIALNSGDLTKDTTTYQVLMDTVLLKARLLFNAGNGGDGQQMVIHHMGELEKAIIDLDAFTEGDRNGRDEQGGIQQVPDAELRPGNEMRLSKVPETTSGDVEKQP